MVNGIHYVPRDIQDPFLFFKFVQMLGGPSLVG